MSAHNLHTLCSNHPRAALYAQRVGANASCVLPPLGARGASLTLSDCSELSSATSRDDNRASKPYEMKRRSRCASGGGSQRSHNNGGCGGARRIGGVHMKRSAAQPTGGKKVRSSKSNIPGESRYWTPSEHKLFIEALWKFGPKNLKAISAYVGTRNMIQCRTHEQKCFMRLMREAQRENMARNGVRMDALVDDKGRKLKAPKDVYSVSPQCGLLLLCAVSEEMSR